MNMKKRLLALFLAIALVCALLPATLLPASAETLSGTCGAEGDGSNLTWTLDTETGVLEISGTGEMKDWAWYHLVPWHSYCDSIKTVNIGSGVTRIGESAFWFCSKLTSVTIGNGVTSIGKGAFGGCTALTSVTIPDSVIYISERAFYNCTSLTSVAIPNSVADIGEEAFNYCASLASVYITDLAAWCGIRFWNDSANPLSYAKNLYLSNNLVTDLVIPNSVTSIGKYAFYKCIGLTSVTIPDSVTSIGEAAFCCCTSLTDVTIPGSVKSIGVEAFGYCAGLTNITIPDSVTSIGGCAFMRCTGLTSVTISNSVTSIGYMTFYECTALTSATIPNGVTSIGEFAFANCEGLTSVMIANGVTSIGDFAFNGCKGLTTVTIPVSVTEIGAYSFTGCRGLTSVTIPDSVTSIGESTFADCKGLSSVTIGNGVTSIGNSAFLDCAALTGVTIPDSVTSIGDHAFGYYYKGGYKKIDGFTIYGYKDSAAQIYAEENGFIFVDLEAMPCQHEHAHPEHKDATCTEDGYDRMICDDCGEIISDEVLPALGHNIIIDPAISATCTEAGLTEGEHCTRCNYKIGQQIAPALGHNIVVDPAIPATCTASGLTEGSHCTRCDYRVQQEATPALGHVWNDGEITKPATETENGMKTYTCTRCGATKTEIIPATGEEACKHEHAHPEHKGVTCTEDGYDRMICDDCGAVLSEESISKLGHSFKTTLIAPTCTEKGYTFYECTREGCGYTEKGAWTNALGHDFKDGVCTVCGAKDPNYKPVTSTHFNDVKETAWYYDAVNYAVSNGLMNGVGNNNFAPDSPMTRAMLVTVLWRYENSPQEGKNTFTDVPSGEWYTDAVAWAAHNGIVGGVGNGKFDPNGNITREQMAAILYRYANGKGFDTAARGDLSKFPDTSKVSSWAKDAIAWAVAEGIIGGSDGKLLPQGNATRAQVATILMRFIEGAKNAAPYDTQGHTYEFFRGMYSWADAQKAAAEKGGYLARFDSEDEFRYVTNEITKAGYRDVNFIIGARRADGSKDYYFVDADGKPVGGKLNAASSWASAYWASGEPTYEWNGDQEWIVALEYKADEAKWTLNDIPDNAAYPVDPNRHGFIIEYEP